MSVYFGESSPETITAFMQQIIVEYHNLDRNHRRSEPRELVAIPVTVQEMSEVLQPIGEPFQAVTRDISYGGIGLFHVSSLEHHRFLKITLVSPERDDVKMTILARVEHTTKCGGFYIIGCRFAVCLETDTIDDIQCCDRDEYAESATASTSLLG